MTGNKQPGSPGPHNPMRPHLGRLVGKKDLGTDIKLLSFLGEGKASVRDFVATSFNERQAVFSPDGRTDRRNNVHLVARGRASSSRDRPFQLLIINAAYVYFGREPVATVQPKADHRRDFTAKRSCRTSRRAQLCLQGRSRRVKIFSRAANG